MAVRGEMLPLGGCLHATGASSCVVASPKDKRGMQKCCATVVACVCVRVFVSFVKRLEIYDATPIGTPAHPSR